jgi:serine/threonine-protein kinase
MNEASNPQSDDHTICFSLDGDSSPLPDRDVSDELNVSTREPGAFHRRYKFLSVIASKLRSSIALHWDQDLGRNVIVKTQHVGQDELERERFLKECRISAALEHPGIIPVYDIQNSPREVCLVMRKVEGKTLLDWLAAEFPGKGLSKQKANRVVQIFLEICNVLEFVHSKEHIHRDIKPSNLMVGEFGKVFLIDWGSAPSSQVAQWATPTYMSPGGEFLILATDQLAGGALGEDAFAGCTLCCR